MGEIHDQLAHDLAMRLSTPPRGTARGRLTWENIEFPDTERSRPDVFSIFASLDRKRWQPITFEVKATRADLLSDLRVGKWQRYWSFSSRIVFAVPKGICQPTDVPSEAGLIIRDINGWSWVRRGRNNKEWTLSERQWMNLCLKTRNPSPLDIFQMRLSERFKPEERFVA